MKKIQVTIVMLLIATNLIYSQDTLYVYKAGAVAYKSSVNSIDSVTFYKKNIVTPISATITDIDGNIYHTITIGTQTWLVENLRTTKYNDGSLIPNVVDNTLWKNLTSGAYCWYDNNISYKNIYGALYNWYAVNTNKLAPKGWHIPTDAEWYALDTYVSNNLGKSSSVAKALASATNGWTSSTNAGAIGNDFSINNSTQFSALPSGERSSMPYSEFSDNGTTGFWWSSTNYNSDNALFFNLYYSRSYLFGNFWNKYIGMSIRCIKDK